MSVIKRPGENLSNLPEIAAAEALLSLRGIKKSEQPESSKSSPISEEEWSAMQTLILSALLVPKTADPGSSTPRPTSPETPPNKPYSKTVVLVCKYCRGINYFNHRDQLNSAHQMSVIKKLESLCKETMLNKNQQITRQKGCDVSTQTGDPTPEADSTLDDKVAMVSNDILSKSASTSTAMFNNSMTPNIRRSNGDATEKVTGKRSSLLNRKRNSSYAETNWESPKMKSKKKLTPHEHHFYDKTPSKTKNKSNFRDDLVPIGDGHALVPNRILKHMDWTSYTNATRKLLRAVFSRSVLATHSLTGKPSPAFPNKPAKKQLDPALVNDIVQTVVDNCRVPESVVRTSITTKCADESKMLRSRIRKNKRKCSIRNQENIFPSDRSNESDDSCLSD